MENRVIASHGVIYRSGPNMFGYSGWPSVARLDNGALVAACSGFRIGHICPFGKTTLFYSFDGGRTWTPPVVVNDTPLDDRDAGLLALGGNRLLLSWFNLDIKYFQGWFVDHMKKSIKPHEYNMCMALVDSYTDELNAREVGSFTRLSNDGGVTWEPAHRVPVTAPHGPCLLADGSLLYLGKGFDRKEADDVVQAWVSADGGAQWWPAGIVPLPAGIGWNNFFEPHALQLPGGRILAHIRFQDYQGETGHLQQTIFQTVSDDQGKTWSVPWPLGVKGLPPHLIRHSSGAIVCVYGRREAPYGHRAMISADEGNSWSTEWILRDDAVDGDLGYPASVELNDGSILTVYYQKADSGEKPSLLWTRWELPR